ncbi:hypothetical protein EDC01DRAFT_351369 [Geopyxis carbonaria]|nr:hypothetical protein EDC01DRAFT_351369 [Geopyxis carbonaria]
MTANSSYPMPQTKCASCTTPPVTDKTNRCAVSKTSASTDVPLHKKRQSVYGTVNSSTESLCAVYGRGFCFTGNTGTSNNIKATMKDPIPSMDYTEFDSLPPAIRRKYFSSLERLRYAQQSNAIVKPSSAGHLRNLSSASGRLLNNSKMRNRDSTDSFRSHSSFTRSPKLRKHHRNAADAFVLSQTDAKWFLELPETIQRKHFSREERILLATKCESIIVDAADETLYRMQQNRRHSFNSDNSLSDTSEVASLQSFDSDIKKVREEARNSFRWMEEDGDLDLRLNQFQDPYQNRTPPPRTRKRRTLSLTSKNIRTSSSSSSNSASRGHASGGHVTLPRAPSLSKYSSHSTDTDAAYYQDPEARLKLRVYLSSPQKFDEAVEFGFPSQTEANEFFHGVKPKLPTIRKVDPEDDPILDSFSDLEDEHWIEIPEKVTEQLSFEINNGEKGREPDQVPRVPSSGSGSSSSRYRNNLFDHYPHTSPGNREMTLRMTLTRKDLRATESRAPSPKEQPPLILEELPPENAATIDWDAIDRESASGLRRLWRRVKGHST